MDEIQLTQEDIQRSVNAAFDSVSLINELNALDSLTEEETDILDRNTRHLQIMMAKEWFASALSAEQTTTIQGLI